MHTVVHTPIRVNQIRRSLLALSLTLLLFSAAQAGAYESFSATVSLYQGVSISEGMFAFDPRILTLIINPSDGVVEVLPEDSSTLFNFGEDIEFYFSYDPDVSERITLMPKYLVGLTVLENTSFDEIDDELLAGLDLTDDPPPTLMNSGDIQVLRLADGSDVVLGNVILREDWMLTFEYIKTGSNAVPEPSALMLFGLGALGIWGLRIRKHKHYKGGNIMKRCSMLIFIFTILTLNAGTTLAAEVAVTIEGTGDGIVFGEGIECGGPGGEDCKEVYPDETILHLEAYPDDRSEFKGWLIDGELQKGAIVIRKDITVTGIFDKILIPEFEIIGTRSSTINYFENHTFPLFNTRGEIIGAVQEAVVENDYKWVVAIRDNAHFTIPMISRGSVPIHRKQLIMYGDYIDGLSMLPDVNLYFYSFVGSLEKSVETNLQKPYAATVGHNGEFWVAGRLGKTVYDSSFVTRQYSSDGELLWEVPIPKKRPSELALSPNGGYAALILEDSVTELATLQIYQETGQIIHEQELPPFFYGVKFTSEQNLLLHTGGRWQLYTLENLEQPFASGDFFGTLLENSSIIVLPEEDSFLVRTAIGENQLTHYCIQAIHQKTGKLLAEHLFEAMTGKELQFYRITEQHSIEVLINGNTIVELRIPN